MYFKFRYRKVDYGHSLESPQRDNSFGCSQSMFFGEKETKKRFDNCH